MKTWLGVDLEVNRLGIWNVGVAIFEGRHCVDHMNVFIKETFSTDEQHGFGAKYYKTQETLDASKRPVWVATLEDADALVSRWIKGTGFNASFGYNSNAFDLAKMREPMPQTLALLEKKPHLDVMPLAVAYLTGRKSYKEFWEAAVSLELTDEGNAEYVKYNAELVFNYINLSRAAKNGRCVPWKHEPHTGAEDLIGFEYPILYYFTRILKKGRNVSTVTRPAKWAI